MHLHLAHAFGPRKWQMHTAYWHMQAACMFGIRFGYCRYGVGSKAVAGAVREGVKQVYWVADGAEGPRGWKVLCSSAGVAATSAACNVMLV